MSIIRALRVLQDARGYLRDDDLKDLADRLGVSRYRLQEVASFFPHFRREPQPPFEVKVCRDMACHLAGAPQLLTRLKELPAANDPKQLVVTTVSCLGRCDRAPVVCAERHKTNSEPIPWLADRAALTTEDAPPHFDFWARCDAESIAKSVTDLLDAKAPVRFDGDASYDVSKNEWLIDAYAAGKFSPYEAAKLLANELQRDGALAARAERSTRTATKPKEAKKFDDLKELFASSYPASICSLLERIAEANVRGMGGAQAPLFSKIVDVLTAPGNTCYVVANGDESEPGTFKDRELLVRAPHLVVEGVILAGLLLGAQRGFIYVRHEYAEGIARLRDAINTAQDEGVCGPSVLGTSRSFPVEVFVSPGGYICGEQSALIEVLEDKRAEPRNRPPELATNGLHDCPTLLNNVETLAWLPAIVLNELDPETLSKQAHEQQRQDKQDKPSNWYSSLGTSKGQGRRLFSICGDVAKPGVYELPIGATVRHLLMDCADGMRDSDYPLKAIAPSGPSCGFVPLRVKDLAGKESDVLDLKLDLDEFRKYGLILGAGLIIYDASRNMLEQAVNCTEFFRNESCGKCLPCRIGSEKLVQIGHDLLRDREKAPSFRATIDGLGEAMKYASICSLGVSAKEPLARFYEHFHDDAKRPTTSGTK